MMLRSLWILMLAATSLMVSDSRSLAQPTETKVIELAKGVYFRKAQTEPKFTGCNQGWVIFRDYVLVIDANFPGQVSEVVESIRKTTDKSIRFVFDTHYHGDHADGNIKYVELGATVLAQERSQPLFQTKGQPAFEKATANPDRAKEYGGLKYGIPSMFFSHKLVFDDGEQRVELIFLGHAHTAGDAIAWLPKHGILFTGDACVNGAFNYTGDSNTESWIAVLGAMQELDAKKVAPGHGELSDAKLLELQKRYFVELRNSVRESITTGRTLAQIKSELDLPFYKEWTGVESKTRGENIEHVFRELTAGQAPLEKATSFQKWLKRPRVVYAGSDDWDAIGTSDADDRFSALAELYVLADSGRRRQLREHFSKLPDERKAMAHYVRRAGASIQSIEDVQWVRKGLAIAAIEGGQLDYRETIDALLLLRFAAEQKGIETMDLFHQIQGPEFIAPENKPMFEQARTETHDAMLATVRKFRSPTWNLAMPAIP